MTQEIKIGVTANTGGAESGVQKVGDAAEGAAARLDKITDSAAAAGASVADLTGKARDLEEATRKATQGATTQIRYSVDRIKEIQKQLTDIFKTPISMGDARTAAMDFEEKRKARASKLFRSRAVQEAPDFLGYLQSANMSMATGGRAGSLARSYRNNVAIASMDRTQVRSKLVNPEEEPEDDENPGPKQPNHGERAVKRGSSMAVAFGKSMLALAGISTVASMAGQAVDMANEESIGVDTLKRRAGDLGVDFEKLQEQTRSVTEGMGLTYVESVRLAQEYAKISGGFANAGGERAGVGLSRAFGLDPSAGVDFMANMRRLRVTGDDDQSQRKLALMIGDSVARSGYSGKGDELLAAISGFAADFSRQNLVAPNVADIAGYMTTLMGAGKVPGLDPDGSMALLSTADKAARGGGNMGDASKNFLYAALRNSSPNISPYEAGALMQGGIFATTNQMFGKDSKLGQVWGAGVGQRVGLNDTTNLEKYMRQFDRIYAGNPEAETDAVQNTFGLNMEQAAAFQQMYHSGPANLHASQDLIAKAGIKPNTLSATGIYGISKIAAANTPDELRKVFGDVRNRQDISDADRKALDDAQGKGAEAIKEALARVVGTHDQEKTEGSQTRDSIAELKNELTRVGGALMGPLNLIRDGVTVLADHFAPQAWKQTQQEEKDKTVDYTTWSGQLGQENQNFVSLENQKAMAEYEARKKAGKKTTVDDIIPYPSYTQANTTGYANAMAERNFLSSVIGADNVGYTAEQTKAIKDAAGGDKIKEQWLWAINRTENRGQKGPMDVKSDKGAEGPWQFLPSTFATVNKGGNIHDFRDGAIGAGRLYDQLFKKYNGNLAAMTADYEGGPKDGTRVAAGGKGRGPVNQQYVDIVGALMSEGGVKNAPGNAVPGKTPLPAQGPKPSDTNHKVSVAFDGAVTLPLKNADGSYTDGAANLRPFTLGGAAGQGMGAAGLTLP